jgi:hypothetical protein
MPRGCPGELGARAAAAAAAADPADKRPPLREKPTRTARRYGMRVLHVTQVSLELMRVEYARKNPIGRNRNPDSDLPEPTTRPPEPANPIFYPDKCAYYITWHISHCCNAYKKYFICFCCLLTIIIAIPVIFYLSQMPGLKTLFGN